VTPYRVFPSPSQRAFLEESELPLFYAFISRSRAIQPFPLCALDSARSSQRSAFRAELAHLCRCTPHAHHLRAPSTHRGDGGACIGEVRAHSPLTLSGCVTQLSSAQLTYLHAPCTRARRPPPTNGPLFLRPGTQDPQLHSLPRAERHFFVASHAAADAAAP
jgi:hypothetical protein